MTEERRKKVNRLVNRIVPRGDGVCGDCNEVSLCFSCRQKVRGFRVCDRCEGKGVDRFGTHCMDCRNNRAEWGAGENAFKVAELFATIERQLFGDSE